MFKFDDSIPLAELEGVQVNQVCFGLHDVIIWLEGNRSISIFVKSRFYEDNGWNSVSGNSMLLDLVGNTIFKFAIQGESKARLLMDDGKSIDFVDSPENFESFAFSLSSGQYIV